MSELKSRAAGKENRRLGHLKKVSRLKYNHLIQRINDWAIKYVFRGTRLKKIIAKRKLIRRNNADESQATISKWVWSMLILVGLSAVVAIDYLIVGGTLDYLLGMQRELQGLEDYYVYLKLLATFALLAIEVAIAIGLILLREHYQSPTSVVIHWLVGIGLASALTAFAYGLMYTKVKNESVNIPVAAATEDGTPAVTADVTESPIPTQKWVMLVGVCSICFLVHVFALMKADSVADSFALAGYGAHQSIYATKEAIGHFRTNRAGGKTEAFYRDAYDHFEAHNAEFAEDQLPSVPSQQDPTQQIPVMRLSPIAQRIIENLQDGAVENLGGVRNNTPDAAPTNNAEFNGQADGNRPPPDNPPDHGFGNNDPNGDAALGNANNNDDFAGQSTNNNGTNHNENNGDAAEADYYRTIRDAEVRNADGEL